MRDQILKIIDDRVNNVGGYKNMSLPQVIEIIASTTDIANMIKDFILWIRRNADGEADEEWYIGDDKLYTLNELFDYWYDNIREK